MRERLPDGARSTGARSSSSAWFVRYQLPARGEPSSPSQLDKDNNHPCSSQDRLSRCLQAIASLFRWRQSGRGLTRARTQVHTNRSSLSNSATRFLLSNSNSSTSSNPTTPSFLLDSTNQLHARSTPALVLRSTSGSLSSSRVSRSGSRRSVREWIRWEGETVGRGWIYREGGAA